MKKLLLLFCLASIVNTIYGQNISIPNGNFEQWTSATSENPSNYSNNSNSQNFYRYHLPFNVTKTTDAYHGTYAVELTTNATATDTSFGYFININPDNAPSSWTGGMAYNQKPVGIRGYYKYNVATADSATIIIAFSKAGVNIGTYVYSIGGIHNTYNLFNFTFSPALSLTPDSVAFGALSCKLLNGQEPQGMPGSILKIDSLSFTGVASQPSLFNGDFESWQNQTYNSPDNWYLQSDNGEGFNKTSDAKAGAYAIELITTLGSDKNGNLNVRKGQISTGYYPDNCNGSCNEQGGYPFSNQIDTLAFWYKYSPSSNDSATVFMNFKKNGVNIFGTGINLHASSIYQYKEVPFNIGQNPDSVILHIESSAWNDTLLSFVGSDLKIDEIHFKSQPLNTGIVNYKNENTINIFPNPTNGKIQIQFLGLGIKSFEIYNLLGEIILSQKQFSQNIEIDLSGQPKGIYFVKINDGEKSHTKKIILE